MALRAVQPAVGVHGQAVPIGGTQSEQGHNPQALLDMQPLQRAHHNSGHALPGEPLQPVRAL